MGFINQLSHHIYRFPTGAQSPNGRRISRAKIAGTQETWLKYQTEAYKKAWPKPSYMAEPRESVYVRDGGEGSLAALEKGPGGAGAELRSRRVNEG